MTIISHRGYWKTPEEKNSWKAFERSFELGFGTETDIRDFDGELVISHDVPVERGITLRELLKCAKQYAADQEQLPLALNVKADGLQDLLRAELNRAGYANYFVFDMSVPDAIVYWKKGFRLYTRESEYEREPSLLEQSEGVWMDGFDGEWYGEQNLRRHLNAGRKVCVVSSELHKRDPLQLWDRIAQWGLHQDRGLMLCTDLPEEAARYARVTSNEWRVGSGEWGVGNTQHML